MQACIIGFLALNTLLIVLCVLKLNSVLKSAKDIHSVKRALKDFEKRKDDQMNDLQSQIDAIRPPSQREVIERVIRKYQKRRHTPPSRNV